MMKRMMSLGLVGAGVAFLVMACSAGPGQGAGDAVAVDGDDIGGVVTSATGPEAGVWVIAETMDLGTRFSRTVVTDDQGRYLIPDLPNASYEVWVRGYGLVDSDKMSLSPGAVQDLAAVVAPDAAAAAQYYPAGYWFSLIEIPEESEFPGTGPEGNGISPNTESQAEFIAGVKSLGCLACHQLGNRATREIPDAFGEFASTEEAWERRLQSGQAGRGMLGRANALGGPAMLAMFADWTDRVTAGELPEAPPRPQGEERNVVITQWDWADPEAYLHDEISTDKRDPTINANGLVYGALELSKDYIPVLDPVTHTATQVPLTTIAENPDLSPASGPNAMSSPYWGDEAIWDSKANVHNPMMDESGRVWLTARVREADTPDFCRAGSDHPSAQVFPVERSGRQLAMYDPMAEALTLIDTCYSTHHLIFAEDDSDTLWTSGGGQVLGWLNTRLFDETGDAQASQGWTPLVLDTNGNGQRDAYTEPGEPMNPDMDMRVTSGFYGVAFSPVDGSIWGSSLGFPGAVVRVVPGDDPSETALTEVFQLPWGNDAAPVQGYSPRGMDIDRNGVVWTPLASGHMASFDRSLCTGPLNGPEATGQHCPEGWTLYPEPLPQLAGIDDSGSAEGSYYTWVDQFDTLGLGANTPINTGNLSEGLLALRNGEWVVMRVPYPLGFFTKWMDGRIDDPAAGWKGRGVWSTFSSRTPFHMETGPGTTSKVFKFQLRPDPLAR